MAATLLFPGLPTIFLWDYYYYSLRGSKLSTVQQNTIRRFCAWCSLTSYLTLNWPHHCIYLHSGGRKDNMFDYTFDWLKSCWHLSSSWLLPFEWVDVCADWGPCRAADCVWRRLGQLNHLWKRSVLQCRRGYKTGRFNKVEEKNGCQGTVSNILGKSPSSHLIYSNLITGWIWLC